MGAIDMAALDAAMTDETACVMIQSPNFFGTIEDVAAIAEMAHAKGALLIVRLPRRCRWGWCGRRQRRTSWSWRRSRLAWR